MKPFLRIALVFLSILFTMIGKQAIVIAQVGEETSEFSAHGFDVLRVEQEDKLTVPSARAEEVWDFLRTWLVEDTTALKQIDPLFTSYWHDEFFTDTYYDTPALQIRAMNGGVRHRSRINLTDPSHRKSGRELMQIKINNLSSNELERGEYKYEIEYPRNFDSNEDKHPLLGIVKPSHRADLRQRLTQMGIDPYAMRPILTITDRRRRLYILRNKQPFLSISHDMAKSELLWAKWEIVELEPELNEIPYTEGDQATKEYMAKIGAEISNGILAKFPDIKRDLTPKYSKAYNAFETQIPFLNLLVKTNFAHVNGIVMLFALSVGILVGAVFFVKKSFRGNQ